jgi:hypothetical protein
MANQRPVRAIVAPTGTAVPANQGAMQLVLVNPDGSAASTVKKQAAQTDSVASTVGALVTDFNALLAKLRTAGVIS